MTKRNSSEITSEMDLNSNQNEPQLQQNNNGFKDSLLESDLETVNDSKDLTVSAVVGQQNDSKKVKLESNSVQSQPERHNDQNRKSRVVHLRNIPLDTNDNDLIGLALSFGRVTNCLILRGKSQAFVEFETSLSAQQMVSYWTQTTVNGIPTQLQPTIRGRHVFCQLSNHKELKTNQNLSNNNSIPNGIHGNNLFNNNNNSDDSTALALNQTQTTVNGTQSQTTSPVIRVVVENLVYPVSLEILHSVFSRVGKVAKIVTFTKNGSFQALIQFSDSLTASLAKQQMDGQNLFHNSNQLRIEYSKLQLLNVKYNNDKSRDYTNPSLPQNISNTDNQMNGVNAEQQLLGQLFHNNHGNQQLFAAQGLGHGGFGLGSGHHNQQIQRALQQSQPFNALQSLQSGLQTMNALHSFQSLHAPNTLQSLNAFNSHVSAVNHSSVLLVSNLNESTTTTDALFTLFGVYGDVIRVKILFNKKDNALIQMSEPAHAQLAQQYLDKVKLFGRVIRVTQSKHQLVQMPKEGQHDAGLTKDFSQSSLHRFKKPGSKNYGNIYPPSATLHLSNIPQGVDEEDIRQAFVKETNTTICGFKFFPKDRKMALIQLQSVEDAIQCLITMHNYQLSESSHLRVSFSKSSI